MKLHFSQESYDYLKYGPRKISEEQMGKYYVLCNGLSRKFDSRESLELRLVSLFKNKVVWLNEVATPEAVQAEKKHLADLSGLYYNLQQDLELMNEVSDGTIKILFEQKNEFSAPAICKMLIAKEIKLESFIMLDSLLGFSQNLSDLVWKKDKMRIVKYRPFLHFDQRKAASIARPFF
jgi:hypothetical protein